MQEAFAAFASHPHPHPHGYLPPMTQQGPSPSSMVQPPSQASLPPVDQQQGYQPESSQQPMQQSLSASVQYIDFPNPCGPQPQRLLWPLIQGPVPVYPFACDQPTLQGVPSPPFIRPICSSADAIPFLQAPQDHSFRHTTQTGLAPHPASTAAAASAPLLAGFGPPVPAVTADPGSIAGREQLSIQQGHALAAAADIVDGYMHTTPGDVRPGSGEVASSGLFPGEMLAGPHLGQIDMDLESEDSLSWLHGIVFDPQSSVVADDASSELIRSPLLLAEQEPWGSLGARGNSTAASVVAGVLTLPWQAMCSWHAAV